MNLHIAFSKKISLYQVVSLVLALLFCSSLRISLLLIYPVLVLALFHIYQWKLNRNAIYLLVFALLCWLFSFRNGVYLKFNLVSFYYFLPLIFLLFASPRSTGAPGNYLYWLMSSMAAVMIVNNVFGIFQYIKHPYDDSFEGLYGTFTVSQNGLALINSILFFYYLSLFQETKRKIYLILSAIFLICMVMGFYGAGLIAFIMALVLTFFRFRLKNVIQLIVICALTVTATYFLMKLVSPKTLDYNVAIIDRFINGKGTAVPRKITAFKNYVAAYPPNTLDFLFGSGPGTFNSRSAFVVGSPSYFRIDAIKSDLQPHYFTNYAYTLWNPSNIGPYDGFMNQPFSSILALLGEYGLLLTLGILYVVLGRYKNMVRAGNRLARHNGMMTQLKMYKFCSIYAFILLIIDNYMEYPEIIALFLIIAKISEQQMKRAFEH